jgi:hypothetical protein
MRRMIDFIREFKFGRPQQFAALLLLAFIALALFSAYFARSTSDEGALVAQGYELRSASPETLEHARARTFTRLRDITYGIAVIRVAELQKPHWTFFETIFGESVSDQEAFAASVRRLNLWHRIPFAIFGVWLAGALWWVTRRLYNDNGGYVALALFCFSLPMIFYSSRVSPDIIAAWGLYGLIYTAIGVAHTLYAPSRKWRPRILLLGVALGVTASAYFAAALVGLAFAIAFMIYLAPGRRKESLGIIAIACVIAFLFLFALYGFDLREFAGALSSKESWAMALHRGDPVFPGPQWLLLGIFTLIALVTFAVWRRARYFGNTAPLIVMTALFMVHHDGAQTAIWALPFIFTFIGGIFADLLETRPRKIVAWSLAASLAAYAALAMGAVRALPK